MSNYFRKVGFGLSHKESVPEDPLKWATDQFNILPPLSWSEKLPSVEDQREIFSQFLNEKEKIRKEKVLADARAAELEKEKEQIEKVKILDQL